MPSDPEKLFEAGETYLVLRDEAALRDNFVKGQRLVYWRHGYSFYDGMHGWFFYDEQQKVFAWDKPEVDREARDALFVRVKSTTKTSPQSLFVACRKGDAEGLRAALNEGVPPILVRTQSFEMACRARSVPCALLLAAIPGVDADEVGGFLRHAASERFLAGVQALLDGGISPNAVDACGQTALMSAAWNGDLELVELLLARGAIPSLKTTTGSDAITFARAWHHDAVVSRLEQALRDAAAG